MESQLENPICQSKLTQFAGWTAGALMVTTLLSGPVFAQSLTLRFAMITAETFPYMDGAERFKELVEDRSDGDIEVLLYPGAQLGDERQINEAILEGTVQIGIGAGAMANLAPIYNIVQVPFLIRGQEHMQAIALGDIGETLAELIEQQAGFRVLGWFSTGDSPIETVDVPVSSPEDLQGLRIRVIESPILLDAMRALGANPTPTAYTEVYTGLQQGIIEGAHLDVLSVDTLNIHEVIGYMTDWEQMTFVSEPRPVIMNAEFFDSLSADHQSIIEEAMLEAADYQRGVVLERMGEIRQKLIDNGITITDVDADAFTVLVEPVWHDYAERIGATELLERIIAATP